MTNKQSENTELHAEDLDLIDEDLDYGTDDGDGGGTNWAMMIALLVAMFAVGFIVMDGLKSETYFYDVDQAVAKGDDLIGKTIRIKGVVEAGTIVGQPGELEFTFHLTEKGESMAVTYGRALPDTFAEGTEVVAQGTVDDNFVLHADEVLVKCPSRYEGAPPTGADFADPQASR
ncbi:MAG: cytochrome c maturation protein CcmE [Bradymonadaceae bacterium]